MANPKVSLPPSINFTRLKFKLAEWMHNQFTFERVKKEPRGVLAETAVT
jgi:hypothetical protein